jgi:hypothetical protein
MSQTDQTATLRIWNNNDLTSFSANKANARQNDLVKYSFSRKANPVDSTDFYACADLDTTKVAYVSSSTDVTPLSVACKDVTPMGIQGASLAPALNAADTVAVAYSKTVVKDETVNFDFTVQVKNTTDTLNQNLMVYTDKVPQAMSTPALPVAPQENDLGVELTATPSPTIAGGVLLNVTALNFNSNADADVKVFVNLPPYTTFDPTNSDPRCVLTDQTVGTLPGHF